MDIYQQLARDEGNRLKPYLDCCGKYWRDCTCEKKGYMTIAVGVNLDEGISAAEGYLLTQGRIAAAREDLNIALPWASARLNDARYNALVNLCFNMGITRLLRFENTLDAIKREDWQRAHDELLDSIYAGQVGDRAKRVAKQLLTGQWV